MRFDIEGFITFDTDDASLVNLLTGDYVVLSQNHKILLTEFLNLRGDILLRNQFIRLFLDKYDVCISNSNLTQYILALRRDLRCLGIKKKTIIAVPNIGYKISKDVIINNDCEYQPFTAYSGPM